jgi:hypothetical protein
MPPTEVSVASVFVNEPGPASTLTLALLVGRVRGEVRADEVAVERPAVLGVGRRVHAGVPTAGADVRLEGGLLRVGEHVTDSQGHD